MTSFNYQFSVLKLKMQKGFTLLELMVAISIAAVLGTMGIAGFTNYNQVQVLQASTNEVVTTLNFAKSRAQSQVKLGVNCSSQNDTLESYSVKIVANSYKLIINCKYGLSALSDEIYTKNLPANISFDAFTSPLLYVFPVSSGGVAASLNGQIVVKDSNNNHRNIIVAPRGGISVQSDQSCPNWDINCDHNINMGDFGLYAGVYGQRGSPGWIRQDINGDGVVDMSDFSILSEHYNQRW